MSRRRSNRSWFDVFVPIFIIVVALLVWRSYLTSREMDVNHLIKECLDSGGMPIVVGHQYTTEFKACKMP